MRIAHTVGDAVVTQHARDVLARIHLLRLDDAMRAAATVIEPPTLRTLDSLHLATALSLGAELAGLVVYDRRLAGAARRAGLTVWAPASCRHRQYRQRARDADHVDRESARTRRRARDERR